MENQLTEQQENIIKEIALADFESGHFTDMNFFIEDEEGDFTGVETAAADYYAELINMGPAGFYEEFRDELDFDPDFVAEYGDEEDDNDWNDHWDQYYDDEDDGFDENDDFDEDDDF